MLNPLAQFEIISNNLSNTYLNNGERFKSTFFNNGQKHSPIIVDQVDQLNNDTPNNIPPGNDNNNSENDSKGPYYPWNSELEAQAGRLAFSTLRKEALLILAARDKALETISPVAVGYSINLMNFFQNSISTEADIEEVVMLVQNFSLQEKLWINYFSFQGSFILDPAYANLYFLRALIDGYQTLFTFIYTPFICEETNLAVLSNTTTIESSDKEWLINCIMDDYFFYKFPHYTWWGLLDKEGIELLLSFFNDDMTQIEEEIIENTLLYLPMLEAGFTPSTSPDFKDALISTNNCLSTGSGLGIKRHENLLALESAVRCDEASANLVALKSVAKSENLDELFKYGSRLFYWGALHEDKMGTGILDNSAFYKEVKDFYDWYKNVGSKYYDYRDVFGMSVEQHLYFMYCRFVFINLLNLPNFLNSKEESVEQLGDQLSDIMISEHLRHYFLLKIEANPNISLNELFTPFELSTFVDIWDCFFLMRETYEAGGGNEKLSKLDTNLPVDTSTQSSVLTPFTRLSQLNSFFNKEFVSFFLWKNNILEAMTININILALFLVNFFINDCMPTIFFSIKDIFLFLDVYFTSELLVVAFIILILSLLLGGFFQTKNTLILNNFTQYGLELINFIRGVILENLSSRQLFVMVFLFSVSSVILLGNTIGLIPFPTVLTSQLSVTLALALIAFVITLKFGVIIHKNHFMAHFLPDGTPSYISPFLLIIEFISYYSRIVSLSVRLFANITAGHTLLKILAIFAILLISNLSLSILLINILLPFLLIILSLEIMIAFLQSYVFFILFVVYLQEVK